MFLNRLMSGIVLLVLLVAGFVLGGWFLLALLLFAALVGFLELTRTIHPEGKLAADGSFLPMHKCALSQPEFFGILATVCYYAVMGFFPGDIVPSVIVTGAFMMAMLTIYVVNFPKVKLAELSATVFSFFYCPMLLSFVFMSRELNRTMVWMILISAWGCDTCAYCVGKLIGKHKIFPVLSPKKSLEGCIGGVLGASILAFLYGYFYVNVVEGQTSLRIPLLLSLVAAVAAVMSMVGDLAASALKREHGIKDYGHLIPGHGGIMDRFDSILMTAPATFILCMLFVK
ncbi:MAG: phosphatidate cytidylyltransferase [Lachnospiraceae bacterium]|nr:phosphatidate cytidylyltransferase [Lachnospiraceae bacterium]